VRGKNGEDSVSLPGLEAACLDFSKDRKSIRYDLKRKTDSVAIVGAGPSGLACALKLASRNFPVTVFYDGKEWGGSLADSVAGDVYRDEIETALAGLPVDFRPGTEVRKLEPLFGEGFRAVYIATGKGGDDFGAAGTVDLNSLGSGVPGVFIGGEVLGTSAPEAIEHGARASRSIEKFLQTGAMDGIPETYEKWPINEQYYRRIPAAPPAATKDRDGAAAEAGRCADCECSACIDVCPMLKAAKRTPVKLAADVSVTINKIEQQTRRIANRLINACNMCGLCTEVCPADVAIGDCLLEARKALFEQGGMPPAFHDYYLRDLDNALSEEAYFEYSAGKYLFFPGCQTGASCPDYVLKPYEAMLAAEGDAGILVTCCGVPAEWAGDEERAKGLQERIKAVWEKAGCPTLVCSCLTCRNRIAENIPEIPVITYFEWMDHARASGGTAGADFGAEGLFVFDPCAVRFADGAGAAVRNLLNNKGLSFTGGEMSGPLAECCGYGGHIYASNPVLYDEIVSERISGTAGPYLAYCSNCRDAFSAQGKQCMHIFDVLFDLNDGSRKAPPIEERRQNRRIVKRKLENLCTGVIGDEEQAESLPRLIVSDELAVKAERGLLSREDVRSIIREAERTNKKLYDSESGRYIAHGSVGVYTCWVVYEEADGGFRLVNIYTHRLRATEEA